MPLSTDPDRTARYFLKTDAEKPPEARPAFVCRFMTEREYQRHLDTMNRAREASTNEEADKLLREAIAIGVIGWQNIRDRSGKPIAYSLDAIGEVLTPREKWQLGWDYPIAVSLEEKTMGESSLPLPTGTGASASGAPPEGASPTSQG